MQSLTTGFAQDWPQILDLPAFVSQVTGITVMSHLAWLLTHLKWLLNTFAFMVGKAIECLEICFFPPVLMLYF